ncbi:MAG TPA: CDP-alcohol phosphatidyltransferase family protein [Actinoplanes sp.]|jgi:phosphatidylglycerophosphate synthase
MAIQFAVLAGLAAYVGLGPAGWVIGAAYAVTMWVVLGRALRRSGLPSLGAANWVTLLRATLVGGVAALVADSFTRPVPVLLLAGIATVAWALDGVDGQVARRTGTTSELGARFDMEIDALLIMVLSVFLAGPLGWWVLAIGGLRYAFVAAAWALPWMRAPLPPRFSRKVVAAVQGIVLVVASAGVLPAIMTLGIVAFALGLLCWSFGRDVDWLWRVGTRPEPIRLSLPQRAAVATARPPA